MDRRAWLKRSAAAASLFMLKPSSLMAMLESGEITAADFGPDFHWGVATAAYQIEGAHAEDGKGPSVWDSFTQRKGKIKQGDDGNVACDFYHRYASDIGLMRQMNIPNFRFSLAWSRILPQGKGEPNSKGMDYYDRVIDTCLEQGIEPWVTLYHWDLPQALEDQGGWANPEVVNWFSDYVRICGRRFGDRVKHWMVLNEPMAFTGLGYFVGMHAPGKRSPSKFFASVHHACLAQAEGGRRLREEVADAQVGSTFSASWIQPWDERPKHQKAARKVDAVLNRLFLEPALGMGYPIDRFSALRRIEKHIRPGDMERLPFDFDFIGLQNYTREVVRHSLFPPFLWAKMVPPQKREVPPAQITQMNWEVYPEGIYHLLKQFAAYPNMPPIIVTENGSAFPDKVEGERVHDPRRKAFLQDYLRQVRRAQKEGVPVKGYFVWTFMDNFEWAEGFEPRFGLVHVDFESQARRVKDSGLWYRDFLGGKAGIPTSQGE